MHELMLAESVIGIVESAAKKANAHRVTKVKLALGALAHVDPEALVYCCELIGRDGLTAGARFEVERTPGQARCGNCARIVEIDHIGAPCPGCGGHQLDITAGEEMQVIDIAVA